MADLGDFFAKKDKKKVKGIKFTTANEIDKKLQEMDRRREKLLNQNKDDEWKEFEERKKDYSGLKIQNIIPTAEEEDEVEPEIYIVEETRLCPWKVTIEAEDSEAQNEEKRQEETQEITTSTTDKAKSTYVPPHLRNKHKRFENNKTKKLHHASDNRIDGYFPSLSAETHNSVWQAKKWGQGRFEWNKNVQNMSQEVDNSSQTKADRCFM